MPHADPDKRRAYQRARRLTPEQKARKAERGKKRRKDPKVRAAVLANCRKRRARQTPAQKERERTKAREYARKKRAAMTPEQREADRAYHREHDRKRAKTPERREYTKQLKRRIRAADKFDKEFSGLPDDMTCCNPRCDNPQVSDCYGPTGLCAEHLAATR